MVLHCSAVHAFEYYDAMTADARRLVDKAKRRLKRRRKSERDGISYYDHAGDDGIGSFDRLIRNGIDPASLFAEIRSGSVAETTIIRRLADRRHPLTGRPLPITHRKRWLSGKQKHAQQVVGHDIQISAPKPVSVLYGLASPTLRIAIADAHHRSVAVALAFMRDNGLIITRSGQDGWREEVVEDALIARYFHRLSRANDPHLHSHSVLMNLCKRSDGSIGAIDTKKIVAYGAALTELYRAELASILSRELGLEVVPDDHGVSLPAIPQAVIELFSKRRNAIVEEAEARGFEPGHDRKAAQKVAYDTRTSKTKGVTAESLRAGWEAEARAEGHDPASFMPAIEATCAAHIPSASLTDPLTKLDREALIEAAFAHEAQLSWPQFLARIVSQVQIIANADEALALSEELRDRLIRLPNHDRGENIYTTAAVVKAEHGLLKCAVSGRFKWPKLPRHHVEAGLEAFPLLSAEQRAAVLHALNRDRVSVINGSAGAGKSFMSRAIAGIAEAHGLRVIGTSAAWTAAHVLRREAGLRTKNTFSLAKLMAGIVKGDVVLDDKTVLIVDEAGMAPLVAIADLVRSADKAGSKIVLVGDVKQLQPVAFGAPMRALARELGYAELAGIRRQRHGWMREASINLAAHRPDSAIDAYDQAGYLVVHPDRSATLAAAVTDYLLQAAGGATTEPLRNQLLITPRNRDVADFNRLVREQLQAGGMLGPNVVRIRAMPRGNRENAEPAELDLAVGDRIIFGARLEIGSNTIFNSDIARITRLEPNGDNPRLTFVFDRLDDQGQALSFKANYRDLISPFSEAKVPAMQHAYAVTVHAAQGATVERAILVDVSGLSAEAAYVGMTRHREYLSLHLNAEKSLSRHRREVARLSRRNQLVDSPEPDRLSILLTQKERDHAVQDAKARARRPQPDKNPSSHVFDMRAWLNSSNAVVEFQRQAKYHGGRGNISRIAPHAPAMEKLGDPTRLSAAEIVRLDSISLTSDLASKAFQLIRAAARTLLHLPSGISIAIDQNGPVWSDEQQRELIRGRGESEHTLVQAALLLLRKPLHWARAWVRRTFGLRGLNPLAAAAHRAARDIQERLDSQEAARPLDVQQPIVESSDAEQDRKIEKRRRRIKLWQALDRELPEHSAPVQSVSERPIGSSDIGREATQSPEKRDAILALARDGTAISVPSPQASPVSAPLLSPRDVSFGGKPSLSSRGPTIDAPTSGQQTAARADRSIAVTSPSEPALTFPWMSDDGASDERADRRARCARRLASWSRLDREMQVIEIATSENRIATDPVIDASGSRDRTASSPEQRPQAQVPTAVQDVSAIAAEKIGVNAASPEAQAVGETSQSSVNEDAVTLAKPSPSPAKKDHSPSPPRTRPAADPSPSRLASETLRPTPASVTHARPSRPRVSSNREIAARASARMVEHGIDPASLRSPSPAKSAPAHPGNKAASQSPAATPQEVKLPGSLGRGLPQDRIVPREATPAELARRDGGRATQPPSKAPSTPTPEPNPGSPPRRDKSNDSGRR